MNASYLVFNCLLRFLKIDLGFKAIEVTRDIKSYFYNKHHVALAPKELQECDNATMTKIRTS